MRPRSAMFDYQQAAVARALRQEQLALLLAPGDGKTVVNLTALLDRGAWPALVVAPASVVEADVWGEEARAWEHLRRLVVTPLVGTQAQRKKLLDQGPAHVEVVSYENLRWLTSVVPAEQRYAAVALDELSKLKAPGTRRFKRMRGRSSAIPLRYGNTGSPAANHLLDLWGEMYMVAGKKVGLGDTFGDYKARWFEPIDYNEYIWRLKCCPDCKSKDGCKGGWLRCACHERAIADIRSRVKPWAFALPAGTGAQKPPLRVVRRKVGMPADVERIANDLMDQLWAELPSGVELEALQASTVYQKLRQLAGGAVYLNPLAASCESNVNPVHMHDRSFEEVHEAKLNELDEVLDELQGEPTLLFYWFQHEATRIKRRLSGRRWVEFGKDVKGAGDAWNRGDVEVMLMHPQSAGYGLNLQHGGSHAVWFSLPSSGEQWVQGNGRLVRPGQKAPFVSSTQLLCGPSDWLVAQALAHKGTVERALMEGM